MTKLVRVLNSLFAENDKWLIMDNARIHKTKDLLEVEISLVLFIYVQPNREYKRGRQRSERVAEQTLRCINSS